MTPTPAPSPHGATLNSRGGRNHDKRRLPWGAGLRGRTRGGSVTAIPPAFVVMDATTTLWCRMRKGATPLLLTRAAAW
jgi:hypothetical protein